LVVPTFESKAAWADDGENERENALPPALLLAAPPPGDLKEALQAAGIEGIPLGDSGVNSSLKGRVGFLRMTCPQTSFWPPA
jgi:hypothetical protein